MDVAALKPVLVARGLCDLLCEGGPQLLGDLLAVGAVDELCSTYPKEFRDDVVAVAGQGQAPLSLIAKDFGISEGSLTNWMKKADIEDGRRPGLTDADRAELREAKKRIRLLEQENEVLRRAAAYLSQANLPGK